MKPATKTKIHRFPEAIAVFQQMAFLTWEIILIGMAFSMDQFRRWLSKWTFHSLKMNFIVKNCETSIWKLLETIKISKYRKRFSFHQSNACHSKGPILIFFCARNVPHILIHSKCQHLVEKKNNYYYYCCINAEIWNWWLNPMSFSVKITNLRHFYRSHDFNSEKASELKTFTWRKCFKWKVVSDSKLKAKNLQLIEKPEHVVCLSKSGEWSENQKYEHDSRKLKNCKC